MDNQLSAAEVEQLMRCFPSVEQARRLLADSGLSADLPAADLPSLWRTASALLAAGAVVAGRSRLLAEARRHFPDNPAFGPVAAARPPTTTNNYVKGNQVVIGNSSAPITVRFDAPPAGRQTPTSTPLRVFFVGASPFDISLDRLRADREFRAVQRHERPDALTVASRHAAGVDDLNAVLGERPDVLHLACHFADGALLFEDPVGDPHPVPVAALRQRLEVYRGHAGFRLSCLVFSVCESAGFAADFADLADTVVAWRGLLDDDCAIAFADRLYRELARDPTRSPGNAARIAAVEVATSESGCENLSDLLLVLPL